MRKKYRQMYGKLKTSKTVKTNAIQNESYFPYFTNILCLNAVNFAGKNQWKMKPLKPKWAETISTMLFNWRDSQQQETEENTFVACGDRNSTAALLLSAVLLQQSRRITRDICTILLSWRLVSCTKNGERKKKHVLDHHRWTRWEAIHF